MRTETLINKRNFSPANYSSTINITCPIFKQKRFTGLNIPMPAQYLWLANWKQALA